jgi:hypothetical protein
MTQQRLISFRNLLNLAESEFCQYSARRKLHNALG